MTPRCARCCLTSSRPTTPSTAFYTPPKLQFPSSIGTVLTLTPYMISPPFRLVQLLWCRPYPSSESEQHLMLWPCSTGSPCTVFVPACHSPITRLPNLCSWPNSLLLLFWHQKARLTFVSQWRKKTVKPFINIIGDGCVWKADTAKAFIQLIFLIHCLFRSMLYLVGGEMPCCVINLWTWLQIENL